MKELESSKEELQSLNEELSTMNSQLQDKVDELDAANSDMSNLLSSTDIATVFLDTSLRIKRFTPALTTLLNILATDIGRPLGNFASKVAGDTLREDCRQVRETLTPVARDVETNDHCHYSRRVRPYRTADDRIEGLVVTWMDVTALKGAERDLREARDALAEKVDVATSELQRTNEVLTAEIAERQRVQAARDTLLHRLMTVQDDERRRISRDLHDRAAQQLAALALELGKIRTAVVEAGGKLPVLDTSDQIIQELFRQIRDVALELRPTALDDLGLERGLSTYLEHWSARHAIATDFHGNSAEFDALSGLAKDALFRIAQEALTNVLRHAKATRVSVLLEHRPGGLQLVVEDNGAGFDAETTLQATDEGRTLGLAGMRERAAMAGGTLQVESSPKSGTTVFVRLPTPPAAT